MRRSIPGLGGRDNLVVKLLCGLVPGPLAFQNRWPGQGLLASLGVMVLCVWSCASLNPLVEKQDARESTILRGRSEWIASLAFSPDQRTLATIGHDSSLTLWDLTSRRIVAHQELTLPLYCLSYSADDGNLITANTDGTLSLRDPGSGREMRRLGVARPGISSLAVAPQGGVFAVGFVDGVIILLDRDSERERVRITGHTGNVISLMFSPDGKSLASAGLDTAVRLWDTQSGKLKATCSGHRRPAVALALSPDGRMLASASPGDYEVKLWDVSRGRQLRSFQVPEHWLTSLTFCDHGQTLALGIGTHLSGESGWIQLWNLASGRECGRLEVPTSWIGCLSLARDGTTLASGENDGTVRLWNLALANKAE